MKIRNFAATSALLIAAIGISTGTAYAAPAPAAPAQDALHYSVSQSGGSAFLNVPDGVLKTAGNQLEVLTKSGVEAASLPLTYRLNNMAYPVAASIKGQTATLTPLESGGTPVADVPQNALINVNSLHNVAESFSPRDQQALAAFSNRSTIGSFTSAAIGAALGAGIGCIAGAVVGLVATAPVATLLGAGPLAGCATGALAVGALGTAAGLLFVGLPIIAFSAFQYFSTITAPCTTPGAYCGDPANPPPAAKK